jgi:hypothetical protein
MNYKNGNIYLEELNQERRKLAHSPPSHSIVLITRRMKKVPLKSTSWEETRSYAIIMSRKRQIGEQQQQLHITIAS